MEKGRKGRKEGEEEERDGVSYIGRVYGRVRRGGGGGEATDATEKRGKKESWEH